MNRLFFSLCFVFFSLQLSAHSFLTQLQTLNSNWKNFMLQAPPYKAKSFVTDRAFIQAHLFAVESMLRDADVSALSPELKRARMQHLDVLHAYVLKGEFPQNKWRAGRVPVFIDDAGVHCAVGFLIQQSGNAALAKRIAANNNYIRVYDIADPEMLVWQKKSGFTVHELALIQPTYDFEKRQRESVTAEVNPVCGIAYFPPIEEYDGQGRIISQKNVPRYLGECKDGVLHGRWIQYACAYSTKGFVVEGQFIEGKKSGIWKHYVQRGCVIDYNPEIIEHWSNGERHGSYTQYDETGSVIEQGTYSHGKKIGVWTTWSRRILVATVKYQDGKKNGDSIAYYNSNFYGDSLHPLPISIDTYQNDVLLHKRYFSVNQKLAWEKKRVGDSLFWSSIYYGEGKIWQQGYEVLRYKQEIIYQMIHDDFDEPGTVQNGVRTVETFEKTGKWIMYAPVQHYLVSYASGDSCHFYMENDRVKWRTYFNKNLDLGTYKDSVVYETPVPFGRDVYNELKIKTETWSFNPNKTTVNCVIRDKDGYGISSSTYDKTRLVAFALFHHQSNYQRRLWQRNYTNGSDTTWTFKYSEYNTKGILILDGVLAADTITREGFWIFRDSTGQKKHAGNYHINKKVGFWEETTDSSRLYGKYVNDVRQGEWIETSATMRSTGEFVSGKREGIWKEYALNNPAQYWIGKYHLGKRVGKWKLIGLNEKVLDRINYD
jgi:antitoxin component YwqK of YwqJK toxin-antitoxin module